MSGYVPEVGHRVRVVLEGAVSGAESAPRWVWLGGDRGRGFGVWLDDEVVVSVERLPDPEPEWQTLDVVRDATDALFVRRGVGIDWEKPWRFLEGGSACRDSDLVRPLTLLVRDGKPVK